MKLKIIMCMSYSIFCLTIQNNSKKKWKNVKKHENYKVCCLLLSILILSTLYLSLLKEDIIILDYARISLIVA